MTTFEQIGPIQMLVVGFGEDADYQGAILDELERLTTRGLIRILDLQFVRKELDGSLEAMEATGLSDEEAVEFGAIIGGLIGLGEGGAEGAMAGAEVGALAALTHSYGLTPDDVRAIAAELPPGQAVGMLLFEHKWAAELKQAIQITGGSLIAQGFLTAESLLLIGREVEAVMEAETAIEVAEAVKGAALLDALITVETAAAVKAAAVAEATRVLIVAGLIEEAAAQEAIEALTLAGLIEEAAIIEAEAVIAAAEAEMQEAASAVDDALAQ